MPKGPISFQSHQKKRRAARASERRRPQRPHELDEWFDYWRERLHRPIALGGRSFWTERMLYGNALAGGLILAGIETWKFGFSILGFATAVLNMVFMAFIWYFGVPWLTGAIHTAMTSSRRPPDSAGLKNELIAFSGLFVPVALLAIISLNLAFWLGWVLFAVTIFRLLRFYYAESAPVAGVQTLAASTLLALVAIFFFR